MERVPEANSSDEDELLRDLRNLHSQRLKRQLHFETRAANYDPNGVPYDLLRNIEEARAETADAKRRLDEVESRYTLQRKSFFPEADFSIINTAAVLGSSVHQIERVLGGPEIVQPRGIGSAEEIPDGGETREYVVGEYRFCINYDKGGVAKGLCVVEGLLKENYRLEQWPLILSRMGLSVPTLPDMRAPAAWRWSNYLGYALAITKDGLKGPVWTVRIYKIPEPA